MRIENSDRGITLSKGLAWTILITVIGAVGGGGWWIGSNVTRLSAGIEQVNKELADLKDKDLADLKAGLTESNRARSMLEARLRGEERASAESARDLRHASEALREIKGTQKEILRILRDQ